MEERSKPLEMLKKLASALRLDLSKADDYAFKREKNPRREDAIVRNAEYEKPKALLLLLLLYFWNDVVRVKRILGYSDRNPRLSREFFRKLLWKYCDEFFEESKELFPSFGGKRERNYCIFCGEDVELEAADKHFARYEHLILHHYRKLLVSSRDYAGLINEEAVKNFSPCESISQEGFNRRRKQSKVHTPSFRRKVTFFIEIFEIRIFQIFRQTDMFFAEKT